MGINKKVVLKANNYSLSSKTLKERINVLPMMILLSKKVRLTNMTCMIESSSTIYYKSKIIHYLSNFQMRGVMVFLKSTTYGCDVYD
jgi:hypothetical protein